MSFNINSFISKVLDKFDNSSGLKNSVGSGSETQKAEQKSWFADWYGKFISNTPAAKSNISQNVFLPQATRLDFTDADVKKQWQAAGGRLYAAQPENQPATAIAKPTAITSPSQISGGTEKFAVSASKNPPDPAELSDLVLKQMGYTAGMVKAYEQKYGEDPRRDVANSLKNCINAPGCVKNPKPLPGKPGAPTGLYTIELEVSNLTTMRLRNAFDELIAPGKATIAGKTTLEIAEMIKAAKERETNGTSNRPTLPLPNGQTIAAAGTTMAPALPFPKAGNMPQVDGKVLAVAATGLGEIALPASAVLIEAVAPVLLTNEFLKMQQKGAALEYIKGSRAQALEQPFPPLTMPMDDAIPLPQPQSEPKAKERPFAEPNAKPQVTDLPNAPTDLVPVPKTKPETTTAQPDAPTIDTDAQPYTPDAPRNNQPQSPPQTTPPNGKDIVPPIIGAVTAAAGKAVADALKTENQSAILTPELSSIRTSLRDPLALKSFDQRYAQIQSDAQIGDAAKQAKFKGYLESAKQLGDGDLEKGLVKDLQKYTFLRGLNLPYGTESRITFTDFGKQVHKEFGKAGVKDVQAYIQGSAVTGVKYTTGKIFDVGRRSDWDMAIASPTLFNKAKEIGVGIRGKGTRTEPLDTKQLEKLGLLELSEQLEQTAGREVGIMIYKTQQDAIDRNPNSINVPQEK